MFISVAHPTKMHAPMLSAATMERRASELRLHDSAIQTGVRAPRTIGVERDLPVSGDMNDAASVIHKTCEIPARLIEEIDRTLTAKSYRTCHRARSLSLEQMEDDRQPSSAIAARHTFLEVIDSCASGLVQVSQQPQSRAPLRVHRQSRSVYPAPTL